MSISANYPNVRPSLLLDFAQGQQLDPRVTFSRSTTAPYYDGKTSVLAEQNLLTYSQDYTNAIWTKSGITNTGASTTAPDGTTTGSLIDDGTSTGFHVLQYSVATNGTVTVSGYAKNITRQYVGLILFSSGSAYISAVFDLVNTTTTTAQNGTGYSVTSATMISVGNGWYRCVLSGTVSSATLMAMYPSSSATAGYVPSYTGTNQQFYGWGAQLEQRSSVTAYNATTTSALTNYIPQLLTAPINSPRFDFNPTTGESLGLLIEQSSTNLQLQSQTFNTGWNNGTIGAYNLTSSANIAPDGTQTAYKLYDTTANALTFINYQCASTTSGSVVTSSVYLKAGERTRAFVYIIFQNANIWVGIDVNLANGTISTNSAPNATYINSTITPVGNGWYRVSVTGSQAIGTYSAGVGITAASATDKFTYSQAGHVGDGYSGIYIWGAQLEALAFPTSYTPTTSAQVTRASDNASMTGTNFSSWYNNGQGTLYTGLTSKINDGANFASSFVSIDNGAIGYFAWVGRVAYDNGFRYFSTSNNGPVTTLMQNIPQQIIFSYTPSSLSYSTNGGTVGTIANTGSVQPNKLSIGSQGLYYNPMTGYIKKIAYYPIAFTGSQLQSLTGS